MWCTCEERKSTPSHTPICYRVSPFRRRLHCTHPFKVCFLFFWSFSKPFQSLIHNVFFYFLPLCCQICRGEISRVEVVGGLWQRCSRQITPPFPHSFARLPPLALICRKRILHAWISGPSGSCIRQRAPKLRSIYLLWILLLLQNPPRKRIIFLCN